MAVSTKKTDERPNMRTRGARASASNAKDEEAKDYVHITYSSFDYAICFSVCDNRLNDFTSLQNGRYEYGRLMDDEWVGML
ncbi:hypothetical protein FRX31_026274 [Thalictrum thalictroides]|uniref:Uncharacterized protein n=1 Tax=Thalictrum thalictroides TaxID=46969 RepID=A0A7J6VIY1_THATH|nr:hypothetical protein FRX31_026274 [Thalictrum thalictroides]